jgi:MoxR-like ATPase
MGTMIQQKDISIQELNARISKESAFIADVMKEFNKVIIGQRTILEKVLIGLFCKGHILLEGVPGLAKTLIIKTLSAIIDCSFKRIQFTPDLLPADILGTMIYNPASTSFSIKKGPIFHNIILADEINRAPAKVQSALLEAMQEKQVTIGESTYKLDEPFLVLATQNPIEQEGTYPLPEAQVDRFMLKLLISYPSRKEEKQIVEIQHDIETAQLHKVIRPADIIRVQEVINDIYIDDKIKEYILDIVLATRNPEEFKLNIKNLITYGASPRASIYLTKAAQAHAFIQGRGFVSPDDVKSIVMDVLRHRVIISYEAEAESMTSEDVIQKILDTIEVP